MLFSEGLSGYLRVQVLQALSHKAERVARVAQAEHWLGRRGGVGVRAWQARISRNCCKMRCQTSHLTMQTGGKWAAGDFVYLFACDLHGTPFAPTLSSFVHPSVCLFVDLSVCPWLSVKTDGLKAEGCCRSWRCTCASSSRTPWAAGLLGCPCCLC